MKLNFLMKVLLRSSKFVSVLLGTILFSSNHSFNKTDLFWAVALTIGIVIFHMGNRKHKNAVTEFSGFLCGAISLVSDTFVSHY